MTNEWLWNIDNKHLNGVIILDLRKAFDPMDHGPWTMDHAILLEKLKVYGVDVVILNDFGPTYLTESNKPLPIELNRISVM